MLLVICPCIPQKKVLFKKKMYFDGKVRYLTWANEISYFTKSVYLPVSFPFFDFSGKPFKFSFLECLLLFALTFHQNGYSLLLFFCKGFFKYAVLTLQDIIFLHASNEYTEITYGYGKHQYRMEAELGRKVRQSINIVANDKGNYKHKRSSDIHRPNFDFLARRRNAHKQGYRQSCNQ